MEGSVLIPYLSESFKPVLFQSTVSITDGRGWVRMWSHTVPVNTFLSLLQGNRLNQQGLKNKSDNVWLQSCTVILNL